MELSQTSATPLNRPELAAFAGETDPPDTIAEESDGSGFWGDDGFTFGDFIDLINPLQHIPLIGTLYRKITGDEIAPGIRIAGGALFGGPLGFAAALFSQVMEDATGADPGEHALALITGTDENPDAAPNRPEESEVTLASLDPVTTAPLAAAPAAAGKFSTVDRATPALPQLTPAAFQALLRSMDGKRMPGSMTTPLKPESSAFGPLAEAEQRLPPVVGPSGWARVAGGSRRQVALELHRLLAGYQNDDDKRIKRPDRHPDGS